MADLELVLFDDDVARDWYPLTLTRPAGELLFGTMTLRERLEAVTGASCSGYITSPLLSGFDEAGAPPVLDGPARTSNTARLYLSSRCVLHFDVDVDVSTEATYRVGDRLAGWLVPPGAAPPGEADLHEPRTARGHDIVLGGTLLGNIWDLVHHNPDHVASDILHMQSSSKPGPAPEHAHVMGKYPLICGDDVIVEPGVVFEVSGGPVWLDDGVRVQAGSRVVGPMYVGKDTTLLGGSYTHCSIGPKCKVHGEIEASVVLGYSNKSHDGFLGHAYVGKWVNLGALTTNSDLKNNYSTVRVHTPHGTVDTGQIKFGSLIGDHVKTAIGTLLNTGTVIGPGANVFGGMPPKHVPPFHWGDGEYELDKFLETAQRVMQRREVALSAAQRGLLTRVYQDARAQKQRQ
ncbi:MAG TPA: putative sugar nucleotidyl transferase [Longimicrobiales bacterium]